MYPIWNAHGGQGISKRPWWGIGLKGKKTEDSDIRREKGIMGQEGLSWLRGWEDRVKEEIGGGINNTKDLSKTSCENLLL